MKRVKIMLTVLGVLAVVGGVVAFMAAKYGGSTYCTAPGGSVCCPTKTPINSRSFGPGQDLAYRQIPAFTICTACTVCTGTGNIIN